MPAQTSPIKHVVIFVKENHTFDNYFGSFPGANGDSRLPHSPNLPKRDPSHNHAAWLNRAKGAVHQGFQETDIPAYYNYARNFVLCDNYYTDVAGPSTPNHLMLICADSPLIDNPPRSKPPLLTVPSLPSILQKAGLTWRNYGGYAFEFIKGLQGQAFPASQFVTDASAGNLPSVSWVYADHPLSEHAPDTPQDIAQGVGNVTKGMQWTVEQVNAVVKGKLWPQVAIFITWDDWGGR